MEIAETQFQPLITFEGELGKFIGQIDRDKFACALTDDVGAGKSGFSFHLASLFSRQGFRVLYYSLEMGINQAIHKKVTRHQLLQNFDMRPDGALDDLQHDA